MQPGVLGWGEPAVLQARAAARVARALWLLPVDARLRRPTWTDLRQLPRARAGLLNCDPAPYVGSPLIGDVSGFVVAMAMITGYQLINGASGSTSAPSPEIIACYTRHRITARRGAPFQAL